MGGAGGLQPPNSLLKFPDFESEKGCKSQGRKNKDSNLNIFKEASEMQYLLMSCKSKYSKFSWKDSH